MNSVLVGTASGLSGSFTIPPPYNTVGCNQTITGILNIIAAVVMLVSLPVGNYTFNQLSIESANPITLRLMVHLQLLVLQTLLLRPRL